MLHIEADTSLPSVRLIRFLEYLEMVRGLPSIIRVNNGPEFISSELDLCCNGKDIELVFIQPWKPMQNGYVERCNGNIRRELLNAYLFETLHEVRERAEQWRIDYNENRPHASLGYVPLQNINISGPYKTKINEPNFIHSNERVMGELTPYLIYIQ